MRPGFSRIGYLLQSSLITIVNTDFASLSLSDALRDNLGDLGYHSMTPIQAETLPLVLAGRDLIAQARTGSGKTAAFGLGILQQLEVTNLVCQALILCPTRELAAQVADELRRLARPLPNVRVLNLSGGTPLSPQKASLEHGAHIVVGTPGRLEDHLRRKNLVLDGVRTLVLDEADRMLDMGFFDTIAGIIRQAPARRQTVLFSATYPDDIGRLSRDFQRDPVTVKVDAAQDQSGIRQHFYCVTRPKHKLETLLKILDKHRPASCLIFCRTRQGTTELATELAAQRHSAVALHGDLEQKERDLTLLRFSNQSVTILVATDVAARGLDIQDLEAVINFDMPPEPAVYVHRIGRTGRAGKGGLAITLLTQAETFRLEALGDFLGRTLETSPVQSLPATLRVPPKPAMVTLRLDAGRKNKLRPGDILGALTGEVGIPASQVGKINVLDHTAYVAISRDHGKEALRQLQAGRIKGRSIRVRRV